MSFFRHLLIPGLLVLLSGLLPAQDVAPIETVAAARALPLQKIREGLPIRLSGVVTYLRSTPADLNFNIHDSTGGVMVYPDARVPLMPGQFVTVTGKTGVSVHGFRVGSAKVVPGEMRGLPLPMQTTMSEVLDGKWEGGFVEIEGIVRVVRIEGPEISPRRLALDFGSRRERLTAWVTEYDPAANPAVPGATVRVRGVPVRWKNPRGQTQSTSLLANALTDVTVTAGVESPAPLPLSEVLLWSKSDQLGKRVSTTGVVTFHQPGELTVVQDGEHAMRVRTMDSGALHRTGDPQIAVGDHVEVVGFPVLGEYTVELEDAEMKRLGAGVLPSVEAISDASKVLAGPALVDRDGRRVAVNATLRDIRERDGRRVLEMVDGKVAFNAWLPLETVLPDHLRPGSELRLTGICTLHLTDSQRRYGRPPGFFSLQLAGIDSVEILQAAPWWNPTRLFIALAALAGAAFLMAFWAGSLRKRNLLLRAEIDARERLERELSTERRRVAGELHDTMEQTLVAAALQLNAAARTLTAQPDAAAGQVSLARQLIARSRQEVRDAVWDLRVGEAESEPLSTLLARICAESTSAGTAAVIFEQQGESPAVSGLITVQAIRVVREAIANALKHAEPNEVRVKMWSEAGRLRLRVQDDGKGFDPGRVPGADLGHFGLSGMAERIQRLGGTLQITSAPGHGATFDFSIPIPPA